MFPGGRENENALNNPSSRSTRNKSHFSARFQCFITSAACSMCVLFSNVTSWFGKRLTS